MYSYYQYPTCGRQLRRGVALLAHVAEVRARPQRLGGHDSARAGCGQAASTTAPPAVTAIWRIPHAEGSVAEAPVCRRVTIRGLKDKG